jgi:hypothetical protein
MPELTVWNTARSLQPGFYHWRAHHLLPRPRKRYHNPTTVILPTTTIAAMVRPARDGLADDKLAHCTTHEKRHLYTEPAKAAQNETDLGRSNSRVVLSLQ